MSHIIKVYGKSQMGKVVKHVFKLSDNKGIISFPVIDGYILDQFYTMPVKSIVRPDQRPICLSVISGNFDVLVMYGIFDTWQCFDNTIYENVPGPKFHSFYQALNRRLNA